MNCSFCLKPREERRVFIVAPDGNAICDRCAAEAQMVLDSFEAEDDDDPEPPTPARAKIIPFGEVVADAIARRARAA